MIFVLADLFLKSGMPQLIRSDSGPEFVAKELIKLFKYLDVKLLDVSGINNGVGSTSFPCQLKGWRQKVSNLERSIQCWIRVLASHHQENKGDAN